METFHRLFGSLFSLVYHCFDRVVIQGYLPLLNREEHIVYFFRDVHGIYPITKPALAQRTQEYQRWVEAFARHQHIPIQWPDKDMKKKGLKQEDYARPYGLAMERQKRFSDPLAVLKATARSTSRSHRLQCLAGRFGSGTS